MTTNFLYAEADCSVHANRVRIRCCPDAVRCASCHAQFFDNKPLVDGALDNLGVKDGDSVAAVQRRLPRPPAEPMTDHPVPDRATIDVVTAAEAEKRGNPPTARSDARPRGGGPGSTMEAQLMGLLNSVQGHMMREPPIQSSVHAKHYFMQFSYRRKHPCCSTACDVQYISDAAVSPLPDAH